MKRHNRSPHLTFDQQSVLDSQQKNPDALGWTQPMAVIVSNVPDQTYLEKAVVRFIETAEIFRLRTDLNDQEADIRLADPEDRFTDIEFLDFTDLPKDEQEAELAWMILYEAEQGWDLMDDWPVRVNAVRLDKDLWAVVFLFHRLVFHRGAKNRYMKAFAAVLQDTQDPARAGTAMPDWFDYVREFSTYPLNTDPLPDSAPTPLLPVEAGKAVQNLGDVQPALASLAGALSLEIPDLLLTGVLLWHHLFDRLTAPDLAIDIPHISGTCGLGPVSRQGRIPGAVTENETLSGLAQRAGQQRAAAISDAAVPAELLFPGTGPDRNTGARIRVGCELSGAEALTENEIRVTPSHADILTTDYDLELMFHLADSGLYLTVVYDQNLMGFEAAGALGREILAVLTALSREIDGTVANLGQVLASSRRAKPLPLPAPLPVQEFETESPEILFSRIAARYPDHEALVTATDRITYQDLEEQSSHLARKVFKTAGRSGRVGILLDQGIPAVIAILAVLKSGNTYVPLDSHMPAQRLTFMARDADLSLVILDRETESLWKTTQCQDRPMLRIDDPAPFSSQIPLPSSAAPEEDAYIIYTSGSTGQPKGVVQTRKNVCHFVRTYAGYLGITPDDSLTLMSAFPFDAAVLDIFTVLATGARLVMFDLKKEDLSTVSRRLHQDRVTLYHSTASVFRYLTDSLAPGTRFPQIRYAVLGGEPSFREDLSRFQAHFDESAVMVNLYGLSELTIGTMGFFSHGEEKDRKMLPIGGPIAGVSVSVVDDCQRPTPGAGQMIFTSPYLARGYWRRPDLTTEKFIENFEAPRSFLTGDIGEITETGALIHLGRKDFQIKIRGYRVEPGEVEACIQAHDQVDKCVVHLVTGEDNDPALTAFIVSVPGTAGVTAADLFRFLSSSLPDYMIPRKVVPVKDFPRTPSGKIDRRLLK